MAADRPVLKAEPRLPISDDPRTNGFVSGLFSARAGRRLHASRRGFLRGTFVTAAVTASAAATGLFGPARRVEAQTGVVGTYPRRMLQHCPALNANDNCQPGCGSSPICTDCCGSDGFFRNDPANGYSLYAGGCGSGDIADGWVWRFQGKCGNCSTIEYRCSDGYVQTDTGPVPFICRAVTECVPLAEGEEPGQGGDAARPTNWRPAGALEYASDNGGSVSIQGYISDGSGTPLDMRITADGAIIHLGKANQTRSDGTNTGFGISFASRPGTTRYCVDALSGLLSATIGCVDLSVGSAQVVGGSNRPSPAPTATSAPVDPNAPTPTAVATPEPTPEPAPASGESAPVLALPEAGDPSEFATIGAVQVLRRSGPTTGFVSGWAGDVDHDEPAIVQILIGDEVVAAVECDLPRADVAAAFDALGSSTGFATSFVMPAEESTVCVNVIGRDDGIVRSLGCRTIGEAIDENAESADASVAVTGDPTSTTNVVYGAVDSLTLEARTIICAGWAFDPNDHENVVQVELRVGGVTVDGRAARPHADASLRYGLDGNHGFDLDLDVESGTHNALVVAISNNTETVLGEKAFLVP